MKTYPQGGKIILIGPMGAGKTTLGKRLAQKLNRRFIDTDQIIVNNSGVDIPLIFEREGEAGFRQREKKALQEAVSIPDKAVIACGGGIVLLSENRSLIMQQELTIFLDISPEQQYQRVVNDRNRPLAQGENLLEKLQTMRDERLGLYEALADLRIETDNSAFIISFRRMFKHINEALKKKTSNTQQIKTGQWTKQT